MDETQRHVNAAWAAIDLAKRHLGAARAAVDAGSWASVTHEQLDALAVALDRAHSAAVVMQQPRLFEEG